MERVRGLVGNSRVHRGLSLAAVLATLVGCDSGLYDPVTVGEIEQGHKAPGLATLGAHVALTSDIRCYPQLGPTRCFYRAIDKAAGPAGAAAGFDERDHPFVIVQIKPGAEQAPGFADRPAMEGRFSNISVLSYEDQQGLLSLRVDLRNARLFIPDTHEAGVLGSWLPIPLLAGIGGAFALIIFYFIRASRGERGFALRIGAPLPAPSRAAPNPAPAPVPADSGFVVGTPVVVLRDKGDPVEATVVGRREGFYQCEMPDGRKAWVPVDRVGARG
jgi:hypothetical protein